MLMYALCIHYSERRTFIVSKYEDRKWYATPVAPPSDHTNHNNANSNNNSDNSNSDDSSVSPQSNDASLLFKGIL